MSDTSIRLTQLRQQRTAIQAKAKRIHESTRTKLAELQRELDRVNAAILREEAGSWVGQQVRFRFRLRTSNPLVWMNDATGVLISVRRSRGTVDFGDRGKWDLRLNEIQHADDTAERRFILL